MDLCIISIIWIVSCGWSNTMIWLLKLVAEKSATSFGDLPDCSVGLSAGIQSARESVPETLVRILHPAEEDNLSPFDSKIACLCQSIEINNKHVCMHVRTNVSIVEKCGLDSKSSQIFRKHYMNLQERVLNAWWCERIHIMFQQLIYYRLTWGGAIKHWSFVILFFFSNFRYTICLV